MITLSSGNSIRGGLQTRGRCFGAGSRTWRPSLICFRVISTRIFVRVSNRFLFLALPAQQEGVSLSP